MDEQKETLQTIKARIIRESANRILAQQQAKRQARRDACQAHATTAPRTAAQIEAEWAARPGAIYGGRRILTSDERRAFAQRAQDEEDGIVRG